MRRSKTVTICSSASFYREVFGIAQELKTRGFRVKLPITAVRMKRRDDFAVRHYKTWFKNPRMYRLKTQLVREHNKKILESDAILVVNLKKRGVQGYVGGSVLMEMALAFHLGKRIYVLNPISKKLPLAEEVLALQPVFLNGDLSRIK